MSVRYRAKKALLLAHASWFRRLIEVVLSIRETMKCKTLTRISTDQDGDWIRKEKGFAVYSPSYPRRNLSKRFLQTHISWTWFRKFSETPSGKTLIDVGAGGGEHAALLSEMVGKKGRVIAVEANPNTFRCLSKTIKENGLENVIAVNAAVFDYNGEIEIEDAAAHANNRVNAGTGHVVQCMTLDQLIHREGIKSVDIAKLNIEGAEREALKGATLALCEVKHWVVSCHDFIAERSEQDANMATYDEVTDVFESNGCYVYARDLNVPWHSLQYYVYADCAESKQ